jgi:hypothetical protein
VRDPLPTIPVPLQAPEPDVSLNLRDCLDRAYLEGRYAEELNYHHPADPPLRPADAAWAAQLVAAL